jgi:hypothetical protein
MEKTRFNEAISKVILVAVLTFASILAFVLYHLVISPNTTTYGANDNINVTVTVDSALFGPPRIDNISPLSGPVAGGTVMTINGENLDAVTEVQLGSGYKCEPITHVSSSQITCTMPPHVAGYVNVSVVSPGYGTFTKDNGFRYLGDTAGIPGVPNTGLFYLGKHIITLYDILTLLAVMALWATALWLIFRKRSRRRESGKAA